MAKKSTILLKKVIVLIICILIVIRIITLVMASYETTANSEANVDTAFYVLNEDYQDMTLNLDSLLPSSNPYTYTFSISNEKDGNIAETDIEYDLKIRTTTNLPLAISLIENENNIADITTNVEKDTDGTYFRTIAMGPRYFKHSEQGINLYTLVVDFSENYSSIDYQDIIELVEISVDSTQTTIQ